MPYQKTRRFFAAAIIVCFSVAFMGCGTLSTVTDYSDPANWAYCEQAQPDKRADVFFINPTVYSGSKDAPNMNIQDAEVRESFKGAVNMEIGIYNDQCRVFAPYYRQAGLYAYRLPEPESRPYFETAYQDVKASFQYYLKEYNGGRPIVLAGFSQGADMCIRLLKDCFSDEKTNRLLVACYAIGWRITPEEIAQYPHLKFAEGAGDVGVIVSFNSEAESVSSSLIVPEGTKTLSINPLNWKTDGAAAAAEENKGACFTDYSGAIRSEIPRLTGAYLDPARGTLKVTDVKPEDYPPVLDLFEPGVYHLYDYQFFYRNLEENVKLRVNAYLHP